MFFYVESSARKALLRTERPGFLGHGNCVTKMGVGSKFVWNPWGLSFGLYFG